MKTIPRLPLQGHLDLTYRCNNNCLHCWLWEPENSPTQADELSIDEITTILRDARSMGCREWHISGGEPMLRSDFEEIFDLLTSNSRRYSLNSNGTLITPRIAKLLRRKGNKMIALYGATADIHDKVTRHPGSFEMTSRGIAYLKEAGAGFTIQIVPMKANFHQYDEMKQFAEKLTPHYRISSPWLFMTASANIEKKRMIDDQRLQPSEVVQLEKKLPSSIQPKGQDSLPGTSHIFKSCIEIRRNFYVSPYAEMSFCQFIKDKTLLCNLRKDGFTKCWDESFIRFGSNLLHSKDYDEGCKNCELRGYCYWCASYAFLENGNYSTPVDYLCNIARENKKFEDDHFRYFTIAGINIRLKSDLPFYEESFDSKFSTFKCEKNYQQNISINLHFELPKNIHYSHCDQVYNRAPWKIFKCPDKLVYIGVQPEPLDQSIQRLVVANSNHSDLHVFHLHAKGFEAGHLKSLTMLSTDQILLGPALAEFGAYYFHSSALSVQGNGLVFMGHSGAGKSTITLLLSNIGTIMCDDRNIIRFVNGKHHVFGTWSHGDVAEVNNINAPIKGIFFINKSSDNKIERIHDKKIIISKLLSFLIKPYTTTRWWDISYDFVLSLAASLNFYNIYLDKSDKIVNVLSELLDDKADFSQ